MLARGLKEWKLPLAMVTPIPRFWNDSLDVYVELALCEFKTVRLGSPTVVQEEILKLCDRSAPLEQPFESGNI